MHPSLTRNERNQHLKTANRFLDIFRSSAVEFPELKKYALDQRDLKGFFSPESCVSNRIMSERENVLCQMFLTPNVLSLKFCPSKHSVLMYSKAGA